ncbi:MAG: chalcone isomerase family protein [Burkholderiaceae bacterium]|nr:chalcone isomerase family protein [Burkholderiaceae bacterium]
MNGVVGRLIAAVTLAIAATGASAQTVEVEGVKLDPTVQVGGTALLLNGAGVRTRAIFKVYVAGLYVPQKAGNAGALLSQKGARRVAITMLRNVDADTFANALIEGLQKNHSEAQIVGFKAQIDTLSANLKAAGEAKKGDMIHLDYLPDAGTRVIVNGQPRGSAIAGEDFYTAVLRIWLGEKPADGDLKKGLLGS